MQTPKHILVIRLSAMGDVAMVVPVVYAFAKANPQVKISFLSKPFHKPIVEAIPGVSCIVAEVNGKHKGIWGLFKLSRQLKTAGITHVADMHQVLRSKILRFFLKLPSASIDKGRREKKALITGTLNPLIPLKTTTERYQEVLEGLGFSKVLPEVLSRPNPTDNVHAFAQKSSKKWLGIAPFAAHLGKQYPANLMKEVIQGLAKESDCQLLLFGGPKEVEILKELSLGCEQVEIVAGQLGFADQVNLIGQLDGMLSMDSGNGHLAAMYGVPTVTLWGVTHPSLGFAPFGQEENVITSDRKKYPSIPTSVYGNVVPTGYEDVMSTIGSEKVIEKVKGLL
ncbi:MAG: ADP-heptose:LPS heptosyltransferase [Flavobacteriales bacterium]|jgi:ADP-heptose:LPS heptosyltransferase